MTEISQSDFTITIGTILQIEPKGLVDFVRIRRPNGSILEELVEHGRYVIGQQVRVIEHPHISGCAITSLNRPAP